MSEAFLLSAVRTPIGKYLGGLAELSAPQLGAIAAAEALQRARVPPEQVDEVIFGNVLQAGVGQNPARQAALKAGLPVEVAAVTINKVCGSALKSVMLAAKSIRAGDADLLVAGGMESMSRALPSIRRLKRLEYGDKGRRCDDSRRLCCLREPLEAAERAAAIPGNREHQDRFALRSQQRAVAA